VSRRKPYTDEIGLKGWAERISRAQPHSVRHLDVVIPGWPSSRRPLRIAFLSDLHAGSQSGDVARLTAIVHEAASYQPDLVLHGGDFMNMAPIGGGRLSPTAIARVMGRLHAPLGRFAVLGNHDYSYDAAAVEAALAAEGIEVLSDARRTVIFDGHEIDIVGLPDARRLRPAGLQLLESLSPARPTIVLAHDPYWFAHVRHALHFTFAGHTHAGQVRLPGVGALLNRSRAPLRWSYGHIVEDGRQMYVTSGLGSSGLPIRVGAPPEFVICNVAN
jgi:predicted MPP superfamily phosphohydrolase